MCTTLNLFFFERIKCFFFSLFLLCPRSVALMWLVPHFPFFFRMSLVVFCLRLRAGFGERLADAEKSGSDVRPCVYACMCVLYVLLLHLRCYCVVVEKEKVQERRTFVRVGVQRIPTPCGCRIACVARLNEDCVSPFTQLLVSLFIQLFNFFKKGDCATKPRNVLDNSTNTHTCARV